MCASPLSFLRAGPPPPRVVLLPDALFFTRAVSIAAGATAAEAASQVELALEAISPFPLAQLYYGWFWPAGAERAFVFASYRRRFTTEQAATWSEAELVLPTSAALFGATVEPATTAVLTTEEGITAVHWETPGVPTKTIARPFTPETTDEQRAQAREEIIRAIGGSKTVIDLPGAPTADAALNDREVVFRSGELVSRLPITTAQALDVRDKGDLAALRAARARDVMMWRVALGCAAALLLLFVGEISLAAGRQWQQVRIKQLNARQPLVDNIKKAESFANQIEELTTKRLLPLEMLTALVGVDNKWKPGDITLTRAETRANGGIYTIFLEVQTNNPSAITAYQSQIKSLTDLVEDVKVSAKQSIGGSVPYEVVVTFKPGAVKPTTA